MAYLFVDGAYLSKAMDDWGNRWYGEPVTFFPPMLGRLYEKVFYYDTLPPREEDEAEAAFQSRIDERAKFFDELRRWAGWHVFFGDSKRRGKGTGKRIEWLG